MSLLSNQRGEYGVRRSSPPSAQTGQAQPETPRSLSNHAVIGLGLVAAAASWPLYERKKPIGVIGLGAAGSMISTGIIGLLLGRPPAAF